MPKPGRKPLVPGTLAVRVLVTLDAATVDKGKRIGQGNLSRGIRRALARSRLSTGAAEKT